jgi:hypothetical protein
MDTPASWSPSIDWNRFAQGAVSAPMWHAFTDLVKLCHYIEHWREAARSLRMTRPAKPAFYQESSYKKLINEWRQGIADCEDRMHRAAHLADDKVREMSRIAPTNVGESDWNLGAATALSMGISLGRAQTRYKSLALDAFDAAQLTNSDPSAIASIWLERAGYTGQLPQL